MDEILALTLGLARVCERLGVPYVVGGSLASSLHGIPRSTQDVDFVVRLSQRDVMAFIRELGDEFYHDEDAIRDAVERKTSFNLVHLQSYFKADVFVAGDDEASQWQMSRGQRYTIGRDPSDSLVVASPEDVVAQKLYWYALGDRVSERQWSDAIGVLKVAGARLDLTYLRRLSGILGVEALLEKAAAEASLSLPAI